VTDTAVPKACSICMTPIQPEDKVVRVYNMEDVRDMHQQCYLYKQDREKVEVTSER
jgi:uncharacterized protein (UPF0179 family)